MYRKMGRFDCYFCPNQKPAQALLVAEHYPELAKEWTDLETRKGHSFMPLQLTVMVEEERRQRKLFESQNSCNCFGGSEDIWEPGEEA